MRSCPDRPVVLSVTDRSCRHRAERASEFSEDPQPAVADISAGWVEVVHGVGWAVSAMFRIRETAES